MNIFIIDDEKLYSDELKRIILNCELFDLSNLHIDVRNSVEETDDIEWGKYDIAFLDIEIGDQSGIDLGVKIKKANENIILFFVTSHSKYISMALRTLPFQYILKPIDEKLFILELKSACQKIINMNSSVVVKWNNEEIIITLKDIVYIEGLGRNREINLADGQVILSKNSIKHFEKELNQYGFVKSHASFLVNSKFIKRIDKNDIVLAINKTVPISNGRQEIVKQAFINSISARYI